MTRVVLNQKMTSIFLVFGWLITVVFAFWWFELKWFQSFSVPDQKVWQQNSEAWFKAEHFVESGVTLGGADKHITVINIVDPNCPCSRYSIPHIRTLMETFSSEDVQFFLLPGSQKSAWKTDDVFRGIESLGLSMQQSFLSVISMTPAVMVFNQDQQLAYFGPYSEGATCGQGQGYVELVLDSLISTGVNPKWMNTSAIGCFCPWNVDSITS